MGPKKRPTRTPKRAPLRSSNFAAQLARIKKHEPIDISIHPANSFVSLNIAPDKLKNLNIPVAERKWQPPSLLLVPAANAIGSLPGANKSAELNQRGPGVETKSTGAQTRTQIGQKPSEAIDSPVNDTDFHSLLHNDQVTSYSPNSLSESSTTPKLNAFVSHQNPHLYPSVPASSIGRESLRSSNNLSSSDKTSSKKSLARKGPSTRIQHNTQPSQTVSLGRGRRQSAKYSPSSSQAECNSELQNMAPVRDTNSVNGKIKEILQQLFEVQTQVHGFIPDTQPLLVEKMTELAESLAHLQTITSPTESPNNPIHQTRIAPEIIDYVDDGRNPDIFTRDFVELVQRGNAVINGKQEAFRDFSDIFAKALKEGIEGVGPDVDRIMRNVAEDESKPQAPPVRENGVSKS